MAFIKDVDTNETIECRTAPYGEEDQLDEFIGRAGFSRDDEDVRLMSHEDVEWWVRWAENETRINEAMEEAEWWLLDDLAASLALVYGMEEAQRVAMTILGI